MKVLITGVAGFVGSHLAESLLTDGHEVVGVDSLTNYYSPTIKLGNLATAEQDDKFAFLQQDILDLTPDHIGGTDVCIHLAGQPGVRDSWNQFDLYTRQNLVATQHLAQVLSAAGVSRMVFASSSSVYGDQTSYPCRETDTLLPRSPYGVTKLGGEYLLRAFSSSFELEVIALRFFTVYGPRQRPDMATQRLINAALTGGPFNLFGNGTARRDFTYVEDVVDACRRSVDAVLPERFTAVNIGGTGETSMSQLVEQIEELTGRKIQLRVTAKQLGDVDRTGADFAKAHKILGWSPTRTLKYGLEQQVLHVVHQLPQGD
ncbi:NAD-dependent epimerase/dehydratase family protein [Rhodococcoides fascians]|uniref:NAD-dependent epimerase/dehydratase family protein n=1 Tax=Rhodococcoides fascians TaxID=1828 RepID=UPI001E3551DF|nr:GDP-mannose 4,6-dehydratase [Rhodococcus fascians]